MVERLGLVGLPNSGKSSLFNALTGASTVVAPHPFSTTETAVGLAQVPDERVDLLGEMSNSKKLVYTSFEIVDIAALVKGASTGEGLGNRFLGSLRDCDAILYVLRAFDDPSVPGDADPQSDLDTLELELVLADLASVEGASTASGVPPRATSRSPPRSPRSSGPPRSSATARPIYRSDLTDDEREHLAPAFLLTTKPVLVVVNIGEDQLEQVDELVAPFRVAASRRSASACSSRPKPRSSTPRRASSCSRASASARRRAASPAPRTTCSAGAPSSPPATPSRARGRSAPAPRRPSAPGVIHSDLQRGFIRAEVIFWRRAARHRLVGEGQGAGQAARRGEGLRGRRRRRPRDPLQRVTRRGNGLARAGR